MAIAETHRDMGTGRALVTLTGTPAEVAAALAAGTGVTAGYEWNGDVKRLVWQTGVVAAQSVCYIVTNDVP